MTDVQIKSFLTLAEELNFTKASKRLCISQSTLSAHISSLEKNLEITLFIRTNKSVVLSPAGQFVYPIFFRAYHMINQGVMEAKKMQEGHLNMLRIGFLDGMRPDVVWYIMKFINEFCEIRPNIKTQILSMSDNEHFEMLENNLLDIAFTFGRLLDTKTELEGKIMLKTHLNILYSKSKYGEKHPFTMEALERESLIIIKKEIAPSEEAYLHVFQEQTGRNFRKIIRVNSMETKLFYISAGLGVGFSDQVTRLVEDKMYGSFLLEDIPVTYGFAYKKNTKNENVKDFFEYLQGRDFL